MRSAAWSDTKDGNKTKIDKFCFKKEFDIFI